MRRLISEMNGWQRIFFTGFICWVIFVSLFTWSEISSSLANHAKWSKNYCDIENKYKQPNEIGKDCQAIYDEAFNEMWQDYISEWWYVPIFIFTPPVIIVLLILLSNVFLRIYFWILKGFSKNLPQPTWKQSIKLSGIIIGIIVLLLVFLVIKESLHRKHFDKAIGECKVEVIKAKIDEDSVPNYMEACMKSKSFTLRNSSSCYDLKLTAEIYSCYE